MQGFEALFWSKTKTTTLFQVFEVSALERWQRFWGAPRREGFAELQGKFFGLCSFEIAVLLVMFCRLNACWSLC
jgi:hypothetical protein